MVGRGGRGVAQHVRRLPCSYWCRPLQPRAGCAHRAGAIDQNARRLCPAHHRVWRQRRRRHHPQPCCDDVLATGTPPVPPPYRATGTARGQQHAVGVCSAQGVLRVVVWWHAAPAQGCVRATAWCSCAPRHGPARRRRPGTVATGVLAAADRHGGCCKTTVLLSAAPVAPPALVSSWCALAPPALRRQAVPRLRRRLVSFSQCLCGLGVFASLRRANT